jgi:hypothetical protein
VDRKTRICIWVIVLGLGNFLAYTVVYTSLGGDAMNGYVQIDSGGARQYYLGAKGAARPVSDGWWIYSAVHSISIWITVGAVLLAMLTLAKERIVSSMHSSIVRGRTLITVLATIVTLISVLVTGWFLIHMVRQLANPESVAAISAGGS